MTDFNLLPLEYRKKTIAARSLLLIVLLILLLFVIIKYAFLVPIQNKREALNKLTLLKEETTGYSDLDEVLLHQHSGSDELKQRIYAFREMEDGTPQYWKSILDTIINCLPGNSCLNHFNCDNNIILLTGTSKNDKTSVVYLRSLKDSGCFSEVRMLKIMYQQPEEVHFIIQCTLNSNTEDYDITGGGIP
ncbi:MAG TPA: PilN domain-containing protein [Clostridiales bacterium]|jgi:Tfp pilus assembly protein PilN|nr:PilN domain-containing protein [Clostridiales bacterium]